MAPDGRKGLGQQAAASTVRTKAEGSRELEGRQAVPRRAWARPSATGARRDPPTTPHPGSWRLWQGGQEVAPAGS